MQTADAAPKLELNDESLKDYIRHLNHVTQSWHSEVSYPQSLSLPNALGQLQPALQSQTPQEHSLPALNLRHEIASSQASMPQPSISGGLIASGSKSVGPWVVSNRKVQKRYRERQKVGAAMMNDMYNQPCCLIRPVSSG